ncbi:MAG: tetratricopeptide repeat protein [Bacteroidota bacterium]
MNKTVNKTNKDLKKTTPTTVKTKKSYTVVVLAAICFLFAFTLYTNTFHHSYVLDDGGTAIDNALVKKGIAGIPTLLKTTYRYGANNLSDNLYRPLSLIMFAIEWELSPKNPHLNHIINVLFYALSCMLLFIVLRRYFNKVHTLIPFLITLFYIEHPIHTEVVANIKSRDEIMSFFFLLVTLFFLHNWFTKKKIISLIISLVMFFLSFISKEGVITMLFIFPVIAWYFTDAKPKTILTGSLMLVIPAILYILIRHQVLAKYSSSSTFLLMDNFLIGVHDPISHFATVVMLLGKYLLLTIVPYQLVCDYSFNQLPTVGLSNPLFIISLLVYLAIGIYIILNFRKRNPIVFGLLLFIVTISMYSNLVFHIGTAFGERLMFLPSLGLCIAFVFIITQLLKVERYNKIKTVLEILKTKPFFTAICLAIILAFSIKTVARAAEWKSEEVLYGADIKNAPNSVHLCMWWGNSLFEKANKETDKAKKEETMLQAIAQLEKGIAIYPTYLECQELLSVAWSDLGDYKKALFYADNAFKLDSSKAITSHNIGIFCYKLRDLSKAYEFLKKAVILNNNYTDAYLNMGCILGETQKYEEAITEFKNCLRCDPNNVTAYKNLALCYQFLKQPEEANQWLAKANALEQAK